MSSSPDTERVSLKRTLITQERCPSLMTRSAVLNGPSLHRQRKDVTGTQTQSSSPVSGPLFALILDRGKGCVALPGLRTDFIPNISSL